MDFSSEEEGGEFTLEFLPGMRLLHRSHVRAGKLVGLPGMAGC
jgi:hypothetical protein